MNNIYSVKVLEVDENVEDVMLIEVAGIQITSFANVCPYAIEVGKEYDVMISFEFFNEYIVEEIEEQKAQITQTSSNLSCWFMGKHCGNYLESVVNIEEEILISDFAYLEGRYVRIKVDRINVEFL